MLEVCSIVAALIQSHTDRAVGSSLIFKDSLKRTCSLFAVREQELHSYIHFVQTIMSFLKNEAAQHWLFKVAFTKKV